MCHPALLVAGLLVLGACSLAGPAPASWVETLDVGAETVPCQGEAIQTCLLVRRSPDAAWERFYDVIEGYTHEPGVAAVLEVEVRTVADPPADGSSLAYRLRRVVQRGPA